MAEDNYGWLFVDNTPLLYSKKNVNRQQKIETWLNLYELTKELKINRSEIRDKTKSTLRYII